MARIHPFYSSGYARAEGVPGGRILVEDGLRKTGVAGPFYGSQHRLVLAGAVWIVIEAVGHENDIHVAALHVRRPPSA